MKKVFIPALLLLSMVGLSACNADNGLVKGGQAYRDGDAAKVSAEVKEAKEGKIKKITEKLSSTMVMKETAMGQSATIKSKTSGSVVIDLEAKTLAYNVKTTASSGSQSYSQVANYTAKQGADGSFSLVSGQYDTSSDDETVRFVYEELSQSVYSWNYTGDSSALGEALAVLGSSEEATAESLKLYEDLAKKIVISGDASTGNIEIGISEPIKLTVENMPFEVSKMKYVYKDGLLQNSVNELKMEMTDEGGKASISYKSTASFSYVMK